MKIGFIGLGIMGSRMAANLQKQGNSLVVFNRTRAKAEPLLGPCGKFAISPARLAEQVNVLFTMLAHPDAVQQAALGADGFLDYLRPDALWVDCSSVNPSFSKRMTAEAARRRIHFVDAPVTGSAPVAGEAKLTFWVGANADDLETIRPLLLCMGSRIVHTGGHGTGTSMKMVINLLLGNAMAAFAEAMTLGEGLGLSRKLLFDAVLGTPAVAPFLTAKRDKIDSRNYAAEFPLRWMQKDMHLATVSAYETGVALPLTNIAKEMYRLAMRDGHAAEDFSAIYEFLADNDHPIAAVAEQPSDVLTHATQMADRLRGY
ncbi:MAG TPA: NAD(P)-dependent oxidoreductase [Chthoniobacterales bacterium]|jgi:3-hydroxyisobutyrate dehydrogenase/glyoxylate/succinic semialdehyde reductase|nr:NAD(P)-dependent oxidoreductase [Chthoniobacterales bacterium]